MMHRESVIFSNEDSPESPSRGRDLGLMIRYLAAPLVLAVDWLTKSQAEQLFGGVKTLVPGWLAIRVIHNSGGLFGLLGREAATLSMIAALIVLVWLVFRTHASKTMRHFGFACMIGGALGNLLDRLVRGYVVDFVDLWFFPFFNVADLALAIGIVLAGWDLLMTGGCRDKV